ncbi:MAG: ATP-binding protein, partial [Anaerolineae bacterium]
ACRRVLAEELGIEPLPETTALYERIQTAARARKPNLPTQPTRFVGREEDLAQIANMLNDPECRLLTILGPGGIGKTRLALQAVADQTQAFLEGVFFVPLAPLSAAEHLPAAIAEAIGLSLAGQGAPKRQILNYLRGKEMLLILDNFEHLLEGVEFVAEILRQAPEITLLVTSREPLNLRWEWRFEIEGLHYPAGDGTADLQDVANYSAIQLFEHIARRASPRFRLTTHTPAVIRICRLVDGLPLGIEMAATWVGAQTCAQIAKEIEENLNFLSTSMRDVPERHRSLRATFEHSWRLLRPHEQDALATLSVFRGGFQPEAACEVSGDSPDGLQALVDKSLLRCLSSGRCEMHELLRQYAAEKLSTQPEMETKVRDLHCTHYTTFLQAQEDDLSGKRVSQALAAIKPEVANVRTAWGWAVQEAKLEDIGRCLDSLSRFYTLAGPFQEAGQLLRNGVDRVRALIEQADEKTPDRQILLGRLLVEQAHFLKAQGLYDLALVAAQEAIDLASLLGETDPVVRLQATGHLEWGDVLSRRMDFEAARPQLEQSLALARATSLRPVEAAALRSLGGIFAKLGDYAGAGTCHKQALLLSREIRDQPGEIRALGSLGNVSLYQADYAQARVYY